MFGIPCILEHFQWMVLFSKMTHKMCWQVRKTLVSCCKSNKKAAGINWISCCWPPLTVNVFYVNSVAHTSTINRDCFIFSEGTCNLVNRSMWSSQWHNVPNGNLLAVVKLQFYGVSLVTWQEKEIKNHTAFYTWSSVTALPIEHLFESKKEPKK